MKLVPRTYGEVNAKPKEQAKTDAIADFNRKVDLSISKLNTQIENYTVQKQTAERDVLMYRQRGMPEASKKSFSLLTQIENNIQTLINKRIDLQQQKHDMEMNSLLNIDADIMISNAKATEQLTQSINTRQLSQVNSYNSKKKDELDNAKDMLNDFAKESDERINANFSDDRPNAMEDVDYGKTSENSRYLSFLQTSTSTTATNNMESVPPKNIETEQERRAREDREWQQEMIAKYANTSQTNTRKTKSRHKKKSQDIDDDDNDQETIK